MFCYLKPRELSRAVCFSICYLASLWGPPCSAVASIVNFEELSVGPGGFFAGNRPADPSLLANFSINSTSPGIFGYGTLYNQQWTSGGVSFSNSFNTQGLNAAEFSYWSGWSWSKTSDGITSGFGNQYSAFPGGGSNGSGGVSVGGTYALVYQDVFSGAPDPFFNLPENMLLVSGDFANTTYAALSIQDGDMFADPYTTGDFLDVTLTGFNALDGTGAVLGAVTFSLADFRNGNTSILDSWRTIDLGTIALARSVSLSFTSSNLTGTPTYLALDNLTFTAVPEPTSICLLGAFFGSLVLVKRIKKQSVL